MKQYRLSEEDIKKVAHEVALRAGLERGASLYTAVVKQYTETYNGVVGELHKYNESIKD